jgi:hypothetical protein
MAAETTALSPVSAAIRPSWLPLPNSSGFFDSRLAAA